MEWARIEINGLEGLNWRLARIILVRENFGLQKIFGVLRMKPPLEAFKKISRFLMNFGA